MQNPINLQKLKEQFKITSLELKKIKEEKEKSIKNLSDLVASNRIEINSLKTALKKNEEEISIQRSMIWESRKSKSPEDKNGSKKDFENKKWENDKDAFFTKSLLNPFLKKKIKSLKDQTQILKEQFENEKQYNNKIQKENSDFQLELDRLRAEIAKSSILREKVELLKSQLKEAKTTTLSTRQATEKIFQKNNLLIKKYENFLYGDAVPDKKGTPPSAIIKDLNNDLGKLEKDNQKLVQEMEFLLEENKELESKIMFLEEKDAVEAAEYRPNMENRVAVTTEFSGGLESFLVTYSDLITLILVIFVLLYSVSKIDHEKFSEAFSSFQEKEMQYENRNVRLDSKELKMLKRVRELIKDNVDPESLVRSDVRTILIRLKSSDLFAPGSAELIQGAEELILNSIKEEMRDGVKQVHVDGHTDDVPMKANNKFPTNWELSSVRASHVARVIIDKFKFSPDRIVVTGYGQYRPIKPNTSDVNRALNRRVEIRILKDIKVADENKEIKPAKTQNAKSESGQNLSSPTPPS